MRHRLVKLLNDVAGAGASIQQFTAGMTEADDQADLRTRRAVDREFTIIGEATRRLGQEFPEVLPRITATAEIVSFRNVLTHGYDVVEDDVVFSIVHKRLPRLLAEVQALMDEERRTP
jgi:uncharacterized protein with HEPN domain